MYVTRFYEGDMIKIYRIKPFIPNAPFLYPLKISENLKVSHDNFNKSDKSDKNTKCVKDERYTAFCK